MRKKIFTFLLALAASVGMMNAKVTWISDQYGNYEEKGYYAGTPFTKDGVTVTMSDNAFFNVSYWVMPHCSAYRVPLILLPEIMCSPILSARTSSRL